MWIEADQYLPQKNAMRFIDQINLSATTEAVAKASIRADNPLLTSAGLPAHAGIEYMAQAIAGLRNYHNQAGDKNGVIVDVKDIDIATPYFDPEQEIDVFVEVIHQDGKFEVSACRVSQQQMIISAQLSVAEGVNV